MAQTHHPHDKLFKAAFANRQVALDYIRNFLPPPLVARLNLDTLTLDPTSYVSPKLKTYYSDMVYRCAYGEKEEVLITLLFEHKVKPPARPHLQLLRYLVEVWEQTPKKQKKLLPVIPIVVYHGKTAWKQKPLSSYFSGIDELTSAYVPDFEYLLTDLRQWSDDTLLTLQAGLLRNVFMLFKHHGDTGYIRQNLPNLFWQTTHLIEDQRARNLIYAMLVYIAETTEIEERDFIQLIEKTSQEINQTGMTLYENILKKGEEKGIEKGMELGIEQGIEQGMEKNQQQVIRNAVKKGLDNQTIADLTGLPVSEVIRLIEEWGMQK